MTEDEKYLFDLNGYLVLKDVLTSEEVDRCNEAIDRHSDQLKEREGSLTIGAPALGGTSNRMDSGRNAGMGAALV